jgi:hypothetical protein
MYICVTNNVGQSLQIDYCCTDIGKCKYALAAMMPIAPEHANDDCVFCVAGCCHSSAAKRNALRNLVTSIKSEIKQLEEELDR